MNRRRVHAALLVLAMGLLLAAACADEETSPTPTPRTLTLPAVMTESGSVRADGTVFETVEVGDTMLDQGIRGFLSFDLGGLPAEATIDAAVLDISDYTVLGNDPFQPPHQLGNFIVYSQNYGALSSADYGAAIYSTPYNSPDGGAALASVNARAGVTAAAALGYERYQVRLQFSTEADGEGDADRVEFNAAAARLTVTYTAPEE